MTPSNIAIVLGPNLLWPQAEGEIALFDMASASSVQVVTVIEPLIQYSSSLFPEAQSFEVPELPGDPDVIQNARIAPTQFTEKDKVGRSLSSASSTASSCSSIHPPLSKTSSSASQDNSSSLLEKSATGRRSFTSTWFPMPAAAPAAAESTQRASTASSSSSSFDPSSDTESSSSTAGQLRSPTQRPGSSDQGQLETLYEGAPGSPTAFLKFNSPYKRESKNISNNSNALLLIFGSSFF